MDYWFAEQQARLRHLPATKRYLYQTIGWTSRCLGILGARGTGKTTLMLQHINEHYPASEKALYISLDHPRFQALSLYDFGKEFFAYGGRLLLLDEVHKFAGWAGHVKTLYDACPELQIVFSGSSILQMHDQNADLSRRAVIHYLHGMSFREYLLLKHQQTFPVLSLNDITENHQAHTRKICDRIKPLAHFINYLRIGYYPFFLEGEDVYGLKLTNVINQVLETDLPVAGGVDIRQIAKLKKLIAFLAVNVPSMVNIQKLSSMTEISRPKIYSYLERLHQARLLNLVRQSGSGYKMLSKPDKIYLENPNLAHALSETVNPGTIRETFFLNQIHNALMPHPASPEIAVHTSDYGDFSIIVQDKAYVFEIGGKTKTGKQIRGIDNAYIAADGIESGFGRKIPLWIFGFLY